ncbi:unnamed protein product [Gadus morhua 'NCC']
MNTGEVTPEMYIGAKDSSRPPRVSNTRSLASLLGQRSSTEKMTLRTWPPGSAHGPAARMPCGHAHGPAATPTALRPRPLPCGHAHCPAATGLSPRLSPQCQPGACLRFPGTGP